MAGASHLDAHIIILAGVAGLLAGAFSMAAGEFLSVRSQKELFEYQIGLEAEELKLYPEEEAAELALIYEARGLTKEEADAISKRIIADPALALETLAREELGLNPNELGSEYQAALFSFGAFSIGAFVPLLPFFLTRGSGVFVFSITLTASALFITGAALSLFTGRGALLSGLRMLLIGSAAAALTYLIGTALGVAVG
jgi:VIT1/CCC1 family predicted Fe2+/Mn2+ transporter